MSTQFVYIKKVTFLMWMYSIPQTPDGRIEKDRLHKSSLVSLVFFYYYYSLLGENCVIVFRQFRRNFSTWGCVFHCDVCNLSSNNQSVFERHIVFMGVLFFFFVFYTFCLNDKPVVTCTVWIKAIQFVTWLFFSLMGEKTENHSWQNTSWRSECFCCDIHTANTKMGGVGR